jgi:hypothetical protein
VLKGWVLGVVWDKNSMIGRKQVSLQEPGMMCLPIDTETLLVSIVA